MREPLFALLRYRNALNLGDEIQTIAARQYLPRVDALIDRDRFDISGSRRHANFRVILNGWHSNSPDCWPPPANIQPLITSIHITREVHDQNATKRIAAEILVQPENARYMRTYGPVGTRDLWTGELLSRHGIPNYFSGCLTLTLKRGKQERQNYICVNDLHPSSHDPIRRSTNLRIVYTAHYRRRSFGFAHRMYLAERLLRLYASARCVITSRLHCALPCLALGTPVLFVTDKAGDDRFGGLLGLLRTCSTGDLVSRNVDFDFGTPPANKDAYRPLRAALIKKCREFTGWPDQTDW